MTPKRILYSIFLLFLSCNIWAQVSESGKPGEVGKNLQSPAILGIIDALPDGDQVNVQRLQKGIITDNSFDIDREIVREKSIDLYAWQMLERLNIEDRKNAVIEFEVSQDLEAVFDQKLKNIEAIWNNGNFSEAIANLYVFEESAIKGKIAIVISWKVPRPIQIPYSAPDGADVRVSLWENVDNVILDFHPTTGNLFAVLKHDDGTIYNWSVHISTNDGLTWSETVRVFTSSEINDVSAAVVADYLYVGYSIQTEARMGRCNASNGSYDHGYGSFTVFDKATAIVDIALTANVDNWNNRIYYFAILADNSLIYYWADQNGLIWTEDLTGITNAERGLDAHWNQDYVTNALTISFIATNDNVYFGLRGGAVWTFGYFATSAHSAALATSIAAYQDRILLVFKDVNLELRYYVSYDGGLTWLFNIIAAGGSYYQPHVAGRRGGGFRVIYQEEVGEPDPVMTTRRDYDTPSWDTPSQFNETDVVTGTPTNAEWIPPLSSSNAYGALWIGPIDYLGAWFDRIEEAAGVPDISVTPTSLVINQTTSNILSFEPNHKQDNAQDLFIEIPRESAELTNEQRNLLANFESLESSIEIKLVTARVDLLRSADAVYLKLFYNQNFTAVKTRVEQRGANDFSWFGQIAEDPDGSIIIVVKDDELTGSIRINNENYAIRSLGERYHVVIRQDLKNLPPDHPPEFDRMLKEKIKYSPFTPDLLGNNYDDGSVIDILVAYTPSAASASGNINALIQLAVDESNQSYINSIIFPRINLVYSYQVTYTESGSFGTDLTRFETPGDGYMDEVHTHRDNYKADVCVLIINDLTYCGLASTIMADEFSAFCLVHWDCATGYYSFAHEIGHLQGARHNPEADPTSTPFPYGHGYLYVPDGWRTVMAYNHSSCPGGYCTRVQYWSNPDVNYGGVPTGTASTHDNARVLDETAFTVANFRVSSVSANTFVIENVGTATLSVTSLTDNKAWLLHSGYPAPPFDIAPGGSQVVLVSVDWSLISSSETGIISIASNDPDEQTVTVDVTANPIALAGPIIYDSYVVDDDTSGNSVGNGDGIINPGETIELYVDLYNAGSPTALGVDATISDTSPYTTYTFNTSSTYGDIPGFSTATNSNDFDIVIDPSTPDGHVINFNMDITAANGGPWTDNFSITVVSFTIYKLGDVNGDDLCNSTDALVTLSYDVGLTIPPEYLSRINVGCGDVNADGLTNSTDALIILSFDAGISVPFLVCEPFSPPAAATVYKESTKSVGGNIGVTANPVTAEITRGMTVEIPVNIDVSAFDLKLGSYTAALEWDNSTFEFESYKGGTTKGFDKPTVNVNGTDKGKLVFSSAVPLGAKGKVNVLNLKLKVIGKSGEKSALKLSFTSMAAAKTFENLLPYLESKQDNNSLVSVGSNPTEYGLDNYPNPFNPTTKISYSLPVAGPVKILIYNTLGQQVRVLVNQEQEAGRYSVEWNSRNDHNQTLSSGVYILRMQTADFVEDKKLLLLK